MERHNRKTFNKIAHTYENRWVRCSETRKKVRAFVKKFGIESGDTVFEPGCGSGQFTPFILERCGAKGKTVLADVSDNMVKLARKSLRGKKNVRAMRVDAKKTGLKAGLFDSVVCFNCFPHFYPKDKYLAEFYRLLKSGGTLVVAHDVTARKLNALHRKYGFNMKRHSLPAEKELLRMMKAQGFRARAASGSGNYLVKAKKPV